MEIFFCFPRIFVLLLLTPEKRRFIFISEAGATYKTVEITSMLVAPSL